jgi:hypothetical protein
MRRPFDCPSFSTAFVTVQLSERDNDSSYQAALKTDPSHEVAQMALLKASESK